MLMRCVGINYGYEINAYYDGSYSLEVPFPGDIIESSLQFSKTVLTDRAMVHSNRKNTRRARRRNAKSRVSIREDDHAVPVKVVQYYCTPLDQKLKTGFLSTSNSNRELLFSSFDTVESCSTASPENADSLLDNRQITKIRRSRRSRRRGNCVRSDILRLSYMLQPQSDFGSNQWFSMPIPECGNVSEQLNFIPSLPAANKLVPLSEKDQCSLTNIASDDFCWKNEAYENHYADTSCLPDNIIHEGTGATSASALNVKNSSIEKKDAPLFLVKRALESSYRKKLLVLDLNGILCDIVCGSNGSCLPHGKVNRRLVFKRPFLDDFLDFCFERFAVGIWSSRNNKNITGVINYVMGDSKDRLLFCWDQSKCTVTGFNTLENRHKPILLKELIKLWDNEEDILPWEKGEFSPSNTLLVDDSPYKALCNPPYTGIFPFSYDFRDEDDNVLGPGGSIRAYLESIAMAADVQEHVKDHPLGQKAITSKDRKWNFYKNIINKNKSMALTPQCW